MLSTVRNAVTAALQAVLDKPRSEASQTREIVSELVTVSDQVIRPLSHQLFDQPSDINLPSVKSKQRVSFASAFALATTARPFETLPALVVAFLLIVGAALFSFPDPIPGLLGLAAIELWLLVAGVSLERWFTPFLRRWGVVTRSLLFSTAVVVASTPPIWAIGFTAELQPERDYPFIIYAYFMGLALSWCFALYQGVVASRAQILVEQKAAVERLIWANARLGAQLWRDQAVIAKVLHNDVQGAVIAAALNLQKDLDAGKDARGSLDAVRKVLTEATDFSFDVEQPVPLLEFIDELNARWGGILSITIAMDAVVASRLENDPVCLRCANDFISEFVTNSVKHGRAQNAHVTVTTPEADILQLEMSNDGLPFTGQGRPGLGARLVQTQALSFENVNLPGGGISAVARLALL